jgi:hypothetical protein
MWLKTTRTLDTYVCLCFAFSQKNRVISKAAKLKNKGDESLNSRDDGRGRHMGLVKKCLSLHELLATGRHFLDVSLTRA